MAETSGKTSSLRPRTASREVRRSQLIEATIASIARHGIGGTTMSTIAERAELSIGLANFHFGSKQKLLESTLVFLAQEHYGHWQRASADPGLTAAQKLDAIVGSHFQAKICTPRKLAVWFAFFGEAKRRAVYRNLIDAFDSKRFELTVTLCEKINDEGRYGIEDNQSVARTLEALYDGFWLNMLMYPRAYPHHKARHDIVVYLSSVFTRHFPV